MVDQSSNLHLELDDCVFGGHLMNHVDTVESPFVTSNRGSSPYDDDDAYFTSPPTLFPDDLARLEYFGMNFRMNEDDIKSINPIFLAKPTTDTYNHSNVDLGHKLPRKSATKSCCSTHSLTYFKRH